MKLSKQVLQLLCRLWVMFAPTRDYFNQQHLCRQQVMHQKPAYQPEFLLVAVAVQKVASCCGRGGGGGAETAGPGGAGEGGGNDGGP